MRIFLPAPSGRSGYSVSGAADAIGNELITIRNTGYINASSVCDLLHRIREKFTDETVPVSIILDGAKYQHCLSVRELAEKLKIELLFLPSYSPNLNLTERLWKFIKKDCLYYEYCASFQKFITAIDGCLNRIKKQGIEET
ncbi:MAG: transposase [Dysgonamonadaceae bacterium]|nr:transposase [Dysgonamonadaceae bacterium]